MNSRPDENNESLARIIAELHAQLTTVQGQLLPLLHAVQKTFGYVPADALPHIAERLNLTRAEVYGTVSFYHDFRSAPAGRRVIRLCQAEACQARGGRDVTAAVESRLQLPLGGTTPDGAVTLEAVYCLGLCASGPSAMVGDRPVARLTPDSIEALFDETAA